MASNSIPVKYRIIALAMTGASNLGARDNSLSFRVGRNDRAVTHVRVVLTPADEYTVEFMRIRGLQPVKHLATVEHVHADNLARVFETNTGLRVSL